MSNADELRAAVIRSAEKAGADLVGFSSAARLNDPALSRIFPEARTVVGAAFRVLRGSFRGVEEGTTYYQYTTTGVETIEECLLPGALLRVSAVLEDAGWTAVPQRRNQMLRPEEKKLNPEMLHTRWYAAGAKEPQLDFPNAAVACGFGEKGLSGSLLTKEFGPFQRYAFVLTDAVLEESPLPEACLCDRCGACAAACPGHALSPEGEFSPNQCAAYYRGAGMKTNPYMPADAYEGMPDREAVMRGEARLDYAGACSVMEETYFYPPIKHGYVSSICGRACDRACYAHLEAKGVLSRSFRQPFRRRPPWELPLLPEKKEQNV